MDGTRRTFRLVVEPEEAGTRLDQFVPGRVEELSRSFVRKIVELGGVHLGGRRLRRSSHPVRPGEVVEVHLDGLPLDPFVLTDTAVIYRDRYLLAVAKPAGVETQPTPARYLGTLYDAVLRYLHDPFRPLDKPPLGMVQRLDRETSGVLVFSIHPRAHRGLTLAFAERRVRKVYLALVQGIPENRSGELRSRLARSRSGNRVRTVAGGGREAITLFRVLEEFGDASLVEVEILTGRTHQIRVHLAEAGHPLLGDRRYGGSPKLRGEAMPRQMLHALRLELEHPVTGEFLRLEAPLPADMQHLLELLRGENGGSPR